MKHIMTIIKTMLKKTMLFFLKPYEVFFLKTSPY